MYAATKIVMLLVVQWHADLNTELSQHAQQHLQQAESTRKLPQHVLV